MKGDFKTAFRALMAKIPTGLLSGIAVGVIIWLTLVPHPTGDLELPLFPGADKVAHAIMFAALCIVVCLELMKRQGWKLLSLAAVGLVAFLCALFGLCTEIAQAAMGMGRTYETLDILADTAGAIGAGGVWAALQGVLV